MKLQMLLDQSGEAAYSLQTIYQVSTGSRHRNRSHPKNTLFFFNILSDQSLGTRKVAESCLPRRASWMSKGLTQSWRMERLAFHPHKPPQCFGHLLDRGTSG